MSQLKLCKFPFNFHRTCIGAVYKADTERRNWTELNWHGLVFDELTNRQAHWLLADV